MKILTSFSALVLFFCLQAPTLHADKSETLQRSFNIGAGGGLSVSLDRGSITVIPGGSAVKVSVNRTAKGADASFCETLLRSQGVEFEVRSSRVYVDLDQASGAGEFYRSNASKLSVNVQITLPRTMSLDLKTDSGSIRIDGSFGGDVTAAARGGSISIGGAVGGSLRADAGRSLEASLPSLPRDGADLDCDGTINIRLGKNVGAELDASTRSGGITVNLPITIEDQRGNQRMRGLINGGGPRLRLTSEAGNIRVNKL